MFPKLCLLCMLQRLITQRLDSPHSPFMLLEQKVCMSPSAHGIQRLEGLKDASQYILHNFHWILTVPLHMLVP